jgi:steroid 5-alpha reductase family enzyme
MPGVTFFEVYGIALGIVLLYMTVIWLASLRLRDASIVDVFWGPGFVVAALVYAILSDGYLGRQILVVALVAVWGLRLSLYILSRNWGRGEDARYRIWREQAGEAYWWISFFRVFVLQGVLLWIISAPLLAAQVSDDPNRISATDVAGLAVWVTGFLFEAVGDYQLARFKADPASNGKVMRTGLWAYTRHPNYFGDAVVWWGFFIIAAGTANGFWTFFGPVLMTFLLVRVSGVALLERSQRATKPEYRDYVESTSAFVPWFPRKRRPASGGTASATQSET